MLRKKKIHHFKNCIKKYQGKNKLSMKKEELEKVGSLILSYFKKEELRRQDVLDLVKMFSLKSAKGKENEIFFFLTGKYVDDIEHLEMRLIEDFKIFSSEYDLVIGKERKTFLNLEYVLFHLLKRLGHKVKKNNFSLTKTEDIKQNHDEILENIFLKLGWEFVP